MTHTIEPPENPGRFRGREAMKVAKPRARLKTNLMSRFYTERMFFWKIVNFMKAGGGPVIFMRPGLSPKIKAFVLAHELGHHLFGHIDQEGQIENYLKELHADVFATWLTNVDSPWRSKGERRWIREIIEGKGLRHGRTFMKRKRLSGSCHAVA